MLRLHRGGRAPRRVLAAGPREHRARFLWWLVLILLLVPGVRSVAAREPSPALSLMPDARSSPPSTAWQLVDADLGTPICDQFRLYLADERPVGCPQAALAAASPSESSGDPTPTAQAALGTKGPSRFW